MSFTTDHFSTAKSKQGISKMPFWSMLALMLVTTACNEEPQPIPPGNSDLHRFGTYLNCPNLLTGTYNGVALKGYAIQRDRLSQANCLDLLILNFDETGLVRRWVLQIIFDSLSASRLRQGFPASFEIVHGIPINEFGISEFTCQLLEGDARASLTRWTGGSDTEPWPDYTIDSSSSNFVRIDSVSIINGSLDNPGSQMFGELSLRFKIENSERNRQYVDWARRIGAYVPETMVFENVTFNSQVWVTRLDNECPF